MLRKACPPRDQWQTRIVGDGITYSATPHPDGTVTHYWKEGGYYAFTPAEVDDLERHVAAIFDMCVEAGDWIASRPAKERRELLLKMKIPEFAHKSVLATWNAEPANQSVYGRFDLRYLGPGTVPQLYEFNAQTPTSLVESGYAQWRWLEETGVGTDQWNSLWERLVEAWRRNLALWGIPLRFDPALPASDKPVVYFAYGSQDTQGEDEMTVAYLADACQAAGYAVRTIDITELKVFDDRFFAPREGASPRVGADGSEVFDGADLDPIAICFLLYPYEWAWEEPFGPVIMANIERGIRHSAAGYVGKTIWFEAPYKMLWSNKAILPILWRLFGDDPERARYLIPSWFKGEEPADLADAVEKPIYAREGASIRVLRDGKLRQETPGDYASDDPSDYVVSAYAPPPTFVDEDGRTVSTVLGAWLVDGEPAGLGIREDTSEITGTYACFVPHIIEHLDQPDTWDNPAWEHPSGVTDS